MTLEHRINTALTWWLRGIGYQVSTVSHWSETSCFECMSESVTEIFWFDNRNCLQREVFNGRFSDLVGVISRQQVKGVVMARDRRGDSQFPDETIGTIRVSELLHIEPGTVRRYLYESKPNGRYASNPFPKPSGRVHKGLFWHRSQIPDIMEWNSKRLGRGARTDIATGGRS